MLRQRSSEVMERTFYRPPYALHVGLGLGVFQTIGHPPNCLFSRAHDNVASVQTVGENCSVNMANRLNRRGMQVRRKETARIERRRL